MRTPTAKTVGQQMRGTPIWKTREAFFMDAGLFILGASGAYSIGLIGTLPGCEVVIFPMLPVLLIYQGRRAFNRRYLWFYVLTAAWLLGTLIADTFVGSNFEVRSKGTARVIFFMLDFTALAVLLNGKTRRILIFAISIGAVQYWGSRDFRGDFNEMWKFGASQAVAIAALLVSSYYYSKRRYWICGFIALGLAALNLKYGFRSQLVVQLVAAVLVLPLFETAPTRRGMPAFRQSKARLALLLALAGGAAYLANAAIQYAGRIGLFDESTREKFETQAHGDLGVLVGGRPETLVAIQAIIDRPIIGHGSFPFEPKYLQLRQDIQYEHGYTDTDETDESLSGVIPTHSHLTMAWVESGILGGICWIYILFLTLRGALQLSSLRPDLAPLYSYFLVSFLWDILYSPFGSVNRIWGAFYILLSYSILDSANQESLLLRRERFKTRSARQTVRVARPALS